MEKRIGFGLLLFLACQGLSQASHGSNNACPTEEEVLEQQTMVDNPDEKHHLRYTTNIEDNELPDIGTDQIADFLRDVSFENIETAVNETPSDIRLVGDQDSGLASAQELSVFSYYHVCPQSWFLLRRYQWYWRVWTLTSANTIVIDYWFTYWWVWATWCPYNYCGLYYNPFQNHWDPRYRCYPEYRAVWLPMVCYRWTIVNGVGTGTWVTWQWRKVYVPRGCCCRRYWFWLTVNADICPAIP